MHDEGWGLHETWVQPFRWVVRKAFWMCPYTLLGWLLYIKDHSSIFASDIFPPHDMGDRAAGQCSRQSWGVIASDIFPPRHDGQSSRAMLSSVMGGDCFRHISPTTRCIEQHSYALVSHEGWLLQTYFPHDAVDRAAQLCSCQSWGVLASDIFPPRCGG